VNKLSHRLLDTRRWLQANRIEEVVLSVRAVSQGERSDQAIGAALGARRGSTFADRQGRYYRLASEILGLTRRIHPNVSVVTPLGRRLLNANETQQKQILAEQVLKVPTMQTVLGIVASSSGRISRTTLASTIEALTGLALSTAGRRVSTYISYLRYLNIAETENGIVSLCTLPPRVDKLEMSDPVTPLFPRPGRRTLFREIVRRKRQVSGFIRFEVDAAKRERANATHEKLRRLMASRISACNAWPTSNEYVDVAATIDDQEFIIEVKSAGQRIRDQIRKGVAQLYEYRYLEETPDAKLVLLIEKPLAGPDQWLLKYLLSDRGIYVVWDARNEELFTTAEGEADLPFMR